MSRELKKDFDELISSFSQYTLKSVFEDTEILGKFSMMHKRYYSFMCLVYCLHHLSKNKINASSMARLKESSSDLGTSMFLVINGAYKPANLMMRSCIENFIKSVGCLFDESILEEKSLFKVIERTGAHPVLGKNPKLYEVLKTEYSSLCSYVHTATEKEMAHVKALNVFPKVDPAKVDMLSGTIDKVIKSMIMICIFINNDTFFSFASEYREKILISLSPTQRAVLHSADH